MGILNTKKDNRTSDQAYWLRALSLRDSGLALIGCLIISGLAGLFYTYLIYPRIMDPLSAPLDPDRFGILGENLYLGNGFVTVAGDIPTTYKGPLYPLFIAIVSFLMRGYHVWAIQLVHNLLHVLTCYLVYLIAKELFQRKTALLACVLFGLHPLLLWFLPRIWIETFFTFLTTLTALALVYSLKNPSILTALASGVLLGCMSLTKGVSLFLPFLVAPLFALFIQSKRKGMVYALIIFASAWLVVLPWTIRNYKLTGRLILVHTSGSVNFIIGDVLVQHLAEHPLSHGVLFEKGHQEVVSLIEKYGLTRSHDSAVETRLSAEVFSRVKGNPSFYVKKILYQAATFWYLGETPLKTVLLILVNVPILVLGLLGIMSYKLGQQEKGMLLLISFVLYFWLIYSAIYAIARFSATIVPVMIIFASDYALRMTGTIKVSTCDVVGGQHE
jgi:4-amino-4-deoxy-L-arabinose transferase-like glycosyltransferase